MGAKPPRPAAIATAILFTLSCFGLILFVWVAFGGPVPLQPQKYRFHAIFANASQLLPNADVRMAGVNVGKVVQVKQAGERTDATIELERKFAPIRRNAHAILRQKTLLGETFVAVTSGSKGAKPLRDGGILAPANVAQTQGVDDVLGSFDEPTRKAFTTFLGELSVGFANRGPDLNNAIGNAGPAVDDLSRIVTVLDHQRGDVRRLVSQAGAVLDGVGQRQADLSSLISAGNQVFATTASRNTAVTHTVRALPALLTELRASLAALDTTAGEAGPVIRALKPAAPLIRPALVALPKLAGQLEGAFRDLVPLGALARNAIPALNKVIKVAAPLGKALDTAAADANPTVKLIGDYANEGVAGFANLAASLQATTTNPDGTKQHYLRALIPLTNESFYGQSARLGSNRHNAYPAPGALNDLLGGGFKALDCNNQGKANTIPPLLGTPPPCVVQSPWTFQGRTATFPQVHPEP
jgi:phospholipid/cholesterol/gamma-HCH transport system substrate-binding protein